MNNIKDICKGNYDLRIEGKILDPRLFSGNKSTISC